MLICTCLLLHVCNIEQFHLSCQLYLRMCSLKYTKRQILTEKLFTKVNIWETIDSNTQRIAKFTLMCAIIVHTRVTLENINSCSIRISKQCKIKKVAKRGGKSWQTTSMLYGVLGKGNPKMVGLTDFMIMSNLQKYRHRAINTKVNRRN